MASTVQAPTTIVKATDPHKLALSIRASCLVFEDPASKALLERVERIAPSEATALVIGETGTGKELIARHVHELSERHAGPFLAFNCAAISDSLMESELFGHERGAFTGAVSGRAGWFESAHGGTLFLDEIGDLPLALQAKLLRVIQEREIVRVGSRQPIPVDVRLIAATNVKLDEAVAAGRFREDLYYRLNVAPLALPPLRERPGDILPLAYHFIAQYSARLGHSDVELESAASDALISYPWPGNIRELENTIHHALLVCPTRLLRAEDLRLPVPYEEKPGVESTDLLPSTLQSALHDLFEKDLPDLYRQIDKVIIRTAYNYCDENQLRTARLLGVSRNVIRDRLLRYRIIASARDSS